MKIKSRVLLRVVTCSSLLCVGCTTNERAKIGGLRNKIKLDAADQIRAHAGSKNEVIEVRYFVSIDPRMSSGFVEMGEGGDDFVLGVPGNIQIIYAKDSIRNAGVAMVCEVIRVRSGELETRFQPYNWNGKSWVSLSESSEEQIAAIKAEMERSAK